MAIDFYQCTMTDCHCHYTDRTDCMAITLLASQQPWQWQTSINSDNDNCQYYTDRRLPWCHSPGLAMATSLNQTSIICTMTD